MKTLTIKYFLREDRKLENGNIPIYARIILDREKFEMSTKQWLADLSEWDSATQRAIKRSPINSVLSELEHDIHEAYNYLKYHNKPITALALRNQLLGEKKDKQRLLPFAEEYFAKNILGSKEYAPATQKTYKSTMGHLRSFLSFVGKSNIRLSEVNLDFIKEFDDYLINRTIHNKLALKKNSANKYHVNLKSLLFKAVEKKLIERNPYKGFKIKSTRGRLTFLNETELKILEAHTLSDNQSLIRVRDIFLFSVYTGLRFSDANGLTEKNIEIDGNDYWINYRQQKTSDENRIPMLKKAKAIYDKYEVERKVTGYVLPRLSNQKVNAYLKVIADMVGIKKPLTHHVARHTAATTIFLQNGVSLEVTAKQLGHQSLKSTHIYAKVTNFMLRNTAQKLDEIL